MPYYSSGSELPAPEHSTCGPAVLRPAVRQASQVAGFPLRLSLHQCPIFMYHQGLPYQATVQWTPFHPTAAVGTAVLPIRYKVRWTQEAVWTFQRRGKSLRLPKIDPRFADPPSCIVVTILTELSPLHLRHVALKTI